MKILTANQLREADTISIKKEAITSYALMERAAKSALHWIVTHYPLSTPFVVICGTGNNGGDGLVLSQLLQEKGFVTLTYIVDHGGQPSPDFLKAKSQANPTLLVKNQKEISDIHLPDSGVCIDALLGFGTNRPTSGLLKTAIQFINQSKLAVVSLDLPSGLVPEFYPQLPKEGIITATHTLTFQFPKLSFYLPENGEKAGKIHILDIGLDADFCRACKTPYNVMTLTLAKSLLKPLDRFTHKGNQGHLALVAGKKGSIGAALLAGKGAIHSGVGKLTYFVPECGIPFIQTHFWEAMVAPNCGDEHLQYLPQENYPTYAIGPGIGTHKETQACFKTLLSTTNSPMVIDADALNILSLHSDWLKLIPKQSILTPHPKEFERLVGPTATFEERLEKLQYIAKTYALIVVLKGAHSVIAVPEGDFYFNTTGNPGMATAGSGDVLTGILGSLLAQGYTSKEAALLGVFLHGAAGDLATVEYNPRILSASMLPDYLQQAFNQLEQ